MGYCSTSALLSVEINLTVNLPNAKKTAGSLNLFLRLLPSLNDGITNEELGKGSSPSLRNTHARMHVCGVVKCYGLDDELHRRLRES